ncbi:uncharacterized protein C16orf46 homolog [Spea bombifrons]|uniref:uncharacterized protein C16orf46 homolog n=1 Tax=Spea bombifrons TaxID=233779 RepID=UPI00234AD5A5|nr:uncharacterized protein C16orf46 homolog [Spea bombifrons]
MSMATPEGVVEYRDPPEDIRCSSRVYYENKTEQELVEELAGISDKVFEDHRKSIECFTGRGWEVAVCGWGAVSSTSYLQPQKKTRKPKSEAASDCILCLEMCHITDSKNGTPETKNTTDSWQETTEAELRPDNGRCAGGSLHSAFTGHCPSTATVSKIETYCNKVSDTQPSSDRQRQDKANSSERDTSPASVQEANSGFMNSLGTSYFCTKEPPVLSSPVLLPPLKNAANNGYGVHKTEYMFQLPEKFPSQTFSGTSGNAEIINKMEPKLEKRLLEGMWDLPKEQAKPFNSLSSTPHISKTPSKDSDRLYQKCSVVTQKTNLSNANALSMKQNGGPSQMGFLHTRATQNKRNVRQDLRHRSEMKMCNRAKSATKPMLSNTILPSLTVTRVRIPVVPHRFL